MKATGTNAEWGKMQLQAIENELDNRDYPDPAYLREKIGKLERFVQDIIAVEMANKVI